MPPASVPLANGPIPSTTDRHVETPGFTPKISQQYPKEEGFSFSFFTKRAQDLVQDMPFVSYVKRVETISSDYEEAVLQLPDYVGQLKPEIFVKNDVFFNRAMLNVDKVFEYMNNDAMYNIKDNMLNNIEAFNFILKPLLKPLVSY